MIKSLIDIFCKNFLFTYTFKLRPVEVYIYFCNALEGRPEKVFGKIVVLSESFFLYVKFLKKARIAFSTKTCTLKTV